MTKFVLDDVAAGEKVVITRRGVEVAKLVPAQPAAVRRFGIDEGRFAVPEDFDEPLPEKMLAAFEG
jgi:antitoxin (DNA-binding transcriptional repressor) of toxin-antitoxin stability system